MNARGTIKALASFFPEVGTRSPGHHGPEWWGLIWGIAVAMWAVFRWLEWVGPGF